MDSTSNLQAKTTHAVIEKSINELAGLLPAIVIQFETDNLPLLLETPSNATHEIIKELDRKNKATIIAFTKNKKISKEVLEFYQKQLKALQSILQRNMPIPDDFNKMVEESSQKICKTTGEQALKLQFCLLVEFLINLTSHIQEIQQTLINAGKKCGIKNEIDACLSQLTEVTHAVTDLENTHAQDRKTKSESIASEISSFSEKGESAYASLNQEAQKLKDQITTLTSDITDHIVSRTQAIDSFSRKSRIDLGNNVLTLDKLTALQAEAEQIEKDISKEIDAFQESTDKNYQEFLDKYSAFLVNGNTSPDPVNSFVSDFYASEAKQTCSILNTEQIQYEQIIQGRKTNLMDKERILRELSEKMVSAYQNAHRNAKLEYEEVKKKLDKEVEKEIQKDMLPDCAVFQHENFANIISNLNMQFAALLMQLDTCIQNKPQIVILTKIADASTEIISTTEMLTSDSTTFESLADTSQIETTLEPKREELCKHAKELHALRVTYVSTFEQLSPSIGGEQTVNKKRPKTLSETLTDKISSVKSSISKRIEIFEAKITKLEEIRKDCDRIKNQQIYWISIKYPNASELKDFEEKQEKLSNAITALLANLKSLTLAELEKLESNAEYKRIKKDLKTLSTDISNFEERLSCKKEAEQKEQQKRDDKHRKNLSSEIKKISLEKIETQLKENSPEVFKYEENIALSTQYHVLIRELEELKKLLKEIQKETNHSEMEYFLSKARSLEKNAEQFLKLVPKKDITTAPTIDHDEQPPLDVVQFTNTDLTVTQNNKPASDEHKCAANEILIREIRGLLDTAEKKLNSETLNGTLHFVSDDGRQQQFVEFTLNLARYKKQIETEESLDTFKKELITFNSNIDIYLAPAQPSNGSMVTNLIPTGSIVVISSTENKNTKPNDAENDSEEEKKEEKDNSEEEDENILAEEFDNEHKSVDKGEAEKEKVVEEDNAEENSEEENEDSPSPIIIKSPIQKEEITIRQRFKDFWAAHWKKILVCSLIGAVLVVAGVFTAGVVPLIAGTLGVGFVTAAGIGLGGAAVVGGLAGAGVGAIAGAVPSEEESSVKSFFSRHKWKILGAVLGVTFLVGCVLTGGILAAFGLVAAGGAIGTILAFCGGITTALSGGVAATTAAVAGGAAISATVATVASTTVVAIGSVATGCTTGCILGAIADNQTKSVTSTGNNSQAPTADPFNSNVSDLNGGPLTFFGSDSIPPNSPPLSGQPENIISNSNTN